MGAVRLSIFFFTLVVVIFMNARMMQEGSAMYLWSHVSSDKWNTVCLYYEPVRIVERRVSLGGACPSLGAF